MEKKYIKILESAGSSTYMSLNFPEISPDSLSLPSQPIPRIPNHVLRKWRTLAKKHFVPWDHLDPILTPDYSLPPSRAGKKKLQLEAMILAFDAVYHQTATSSSQPLTVIDFCSGAGHLGLLIAALYPSVHVILLEINRTASQAAYFRKMKSQLTNVSVMPISISDFPQDLSFDIALGLHACGWLTDEILRLALKRRASYIVCPCCVGKIGQAPSFTHDTLKIPRSAVLRDCITRNDFLKVAGAGDYPGIRPISSDPANKLKGPLGSIVSTPEEGLEAIQHGNEAIASEIDEIWTQSAKNRGYGDQDEGQMDEEQALSSGSEGSDGEDEGDSFYMLGMDEIFGRVEVGRKDLSGAALDRVERKRARRMANKARRRAAEELKIRAKNEMDDGLERIRKRELIDNYGPERLGAARRACRRLVDLDRYLWTMEYTSACTSYKVFCMQMHEKATPKNDILVGISK